MWFIGVEVEQETSAPPPKKNPGSAPANNVRMNTNLRQFSSDVKITRFPYLTGS